WRGWALSSARSGRWEQARQKRLEQETETGPHAMVRQVARVIGIGIETADMLVHEGLLRPKRGRKAGARYAGVAGPTDESGARRREQGLARAGNARVRRGMGAVEFGDRHFEKEPPFPRRTTAMPSRSPGESAIAL